MRQLEYVVAVAEELGFSRAATRCFVSQSAISHQVARLERELGAPLFDRSTRRVELTEQGQAFLPFAREILRLRDRAVDAVRPPVARVRLAANMSFARDSLAAIAALRPRFPDAEIEFVIKPFAQRIAAVRSGDADLALIRGGVDDARLFVEELRVDELVAAFAATHPLAADVDDAADEAGADEGGANEGGANEGGVNGAGADEAGGFGLAALAEYPLLMPAAREQVLLHRVIDDAFAAEGLTPRLGPAIAADHTATAELLNHPDAWTVLYEDPGQPGIRTRVQPALRVPVSAVLREDARPNPLVTELLAALREPR